MKNKKNKQYYVITALLSWIFMTANPANAQTWSQLATSGATPNTIAFNATNYDSRNNRLIVFLSEGGSVASQVWVLRNANGLGGTPAWTQLQPTGTPAESSAGSTAVYNPTANKLIVYGGCTGNCGSVLPNVYVLTNAKDYVSYCTLSCLYRGDGGLLSSSAALAFENGILIQRLV